MEIFSERSSEDNRHLPNPGVSCRKSIITGKRRASYDAKHNQYKDSFNALMCNAMDKQKSETVLLLDGINMRSTESCVKIGIKKLNITSIERNFKVYKKHLKNGINSYNGDVWKVTIRPNEYAPYDAVNLDAVSSAYTVFKNNRNIFKNGFLSDNSVLALTITKRSNIKGANVWADYLKLKKLIKKLSHEYNFNCECVGEQEQSKVISVIFILNKL